MVSASTLSYELEVYHKPVDKDKAVEWAMLAKGQIYAGHGLFDTHSSHKNELTDGEARL